MNYPEIDRYASLRSPIHQFDPRAKIVTFTALIFSFVFVNGLSLAMLGLAIALLILVISRIPLGFALQRIKWVFLFLFPLLIIMPLTVEGEQLFDLHGIPVTYEGTVYASLVIIRAMAAVTLALTMLGTTRFDVTIKSLYMLKIPGSLIQMLMFTYRYIFVIIDEFGRMHRALRSKGFEPMTNKHGLSIVGNMIGMLIIKSYDRSERVYQSMISKGYTGNPRTLMKFSIHAKDYLISMCLLSIVILFHTYHLVLP